MSIASEFDSTIENIKSDYEGLENLGADLTNVNKNIQNIRTCLDNIYDNLPKTTGEGSNLSLTTLKGRINVDDILGDTEQDSTTGKNLFIPKVSSGTRPTGLSYNVHQDGTFEATGTINGDAQTAFILSEDIDYTNYFDQDMTLSCGYATTGNIGAITCNLLDENKTLVRANAFNIDSGRTEVTRHLTTTEFPTAKYIRWAFYIPNNMSGTTINIKGKMQLEKGSSATSFEPYTNGASPNPTYPQDINVVTGTQEVLVQNKNLCNGQFRQGGWHDNAGKTRIMTSQNLVIRKGTTLTISTTLDTTQYKYGVVVGKLPYPQTTNPNIYDSGWLTSSSKTFTFNVTGYDIGYLAINVATSDGNGNISPNDIASATWQIEYGSTATSYVEHQEQTKTLHLGDIELCKIGTYQDRIYKNNDKWYIEKNIKKLILNGSEGWNTARTTSPYIYVIQVANYMRTNELVCMSNYFKGVANGTYGSMTNNEIKFRYYTDTSKDMYICSSNFTTLADFKTWLGTHNTEVRYVLATPTYTEITNETLLNELNELEKMMSYNGQTNISVSGNLPMILDVSALKGE